MTAGSGTPMWVRGLRVVSVLLGIAALVRDGVRAVATTASNTLRRPVAAEPATSKRTSPVGSA
ncbi:hypothetical protein [Nocardia nova]|uniref:hypothetical protein n=1 Tax=Nocardia nova TaxID=37330 RepID=UPI001894D0D3|nr:hypothetical protein [Nocardia nova]MBF6149898.1 hypothetical protein [Nocardia nova]MDN2497092.1 hypothetical protein [Nocardia nova]